MHTNPPSLSKPLAVLFDPQCLGAREQRALASFSQSWTMRAGQPLVYRQIQTLKAQGVHHVVLLLPNPDDLLLSQLPEWSRVLGCQIDLQRHQLSLRHRAQTLALEQVTQLLQQVLSVYDCRGGLWLQNLDQLCDSRQLDLNRQRSEAISVWQQPGMASAEDVPLFCGLWLDPAACRTLRDLLQGSFSAAVSWLRQQWQAAPALPDLACQDCQATALSTGIASRSFNEVRIDPVQGRVSKQSSQRHKIAREIEFYQRLPDGLRLYFPRLLGEWDHGQRLGYELEFFPFASLSQHWVFYALPDAVWQRALGHVLDLQGQFADWSLNQLDVPPAYPQGAEFAIALNRFYLGKLQERLAAVAQPALQSLLQAPRIWVNGVALEGLPRLMPQLETRVAQLCSRARPGFVHGDLCFSNILLEPASGMVRLIDPRGDFLGSVNCGDPRYDLAKLLHSVHGQYDFIIHDLFSVQQDGVSFELRLPRNHQLDRLRHWFCEALLARGHRVEDLKILEAMLFLSMLPMHADQPDRQLAFWLIGLQILNEVLQGVAHAPCEGSWSPLWPQLSAAALRP